MSTTDNILLPTTVRSNDVDMSSGESTMSGYLYKKTRDNRWQKRWFETNGVYLTYYKSRKMEKLLAALSLPQVGEIKITPAAEDPEGQPGLFAIELNTRIYTLRAKSDEEAQQWVNMLNKLRIEGLRSSSSTAGGGVGDRSDSNAVGSKFSSIDSRISMDSNSKPATDWIKSGRTFCSCC